MRRRRIRSETRPPLVFSRTRNPLRHVYKTKFRVTVGQWTVVDHQRMRIRVWSGLRISGAACSVVIACSPIKYIQIAEVVGHPKRTLNYWSESKSHRQTRTGGLWKFELGNGNIWASGLALCSSTADLDEHYGKSRCSHSRVWISKDFQNFPGGACPRTPLSLWMLTHSVICLGPLSWERGAPRARKGKIWRHKYKNPSLFSCLHWGHRSLWHSYRVAG